MDWTDLYHPPRHIGTHTANGARRSGWIALLWLAVSLYCAQIVWRADWCARLPKALWVDPYSNTYETAAGLPNIIAYAFEDLCGWRGLIYRDSYHVRRDWIFGFWLANVVIALALWFLALVWGRRSCRAPRKDNVA